MNDKERSSDALIKRIKKAFNRAIQIECDQNIALGSLSEVLRDCRAEIKRLTLALKDSQALNLKFAQDRETADAKIERLNKPVRYVPMTDDELQDVWIKSGDLNGTETMRMMESAIIRRAGLEVVCG